MNTLSLAVFTISASAFLFQLLSWQLFSFVFTASYSLVILGFSFLGIGLSGGISFLIKRKFASEKIHNSIPILASTYVWSMVGAWFYLGVSNNKIIDNLQKSIDRGEFSSFKKYRALLVSEEMLWICGGILLIYFFLGLLLSLLFSSLDSEKINKVYAFDLFGGALGCLFYYLAMEFGGLQNTIWLNWFLAVLSVFIFSLHFNKNKQSAALSFFLCLTSVILLQKFDLKIFTDYVGRNLRKTHEVKQLGSFWNSYTQFSHLKIIEESKTHEAYSLGQTSAQAKLIPYRPLSEAQNLYSTHVLNVLSRPKSVLVIFAGVGADMVNIERMNGSQTSIVGVELNKKMVQEAMSLEEYNLKAFFELPHITLKLKEARQYLEETSKRFDRILISWSGSTSTVYLGNLGHTTQFIYTKEALKRMVEVLNPNGEIVFLHQNKIKLLANIRSLYPNDQRLPKKVAIFGPKEEKGPNSELLIFKPSGLQKLDYKKYSQVLGPLGLKNLYRPYNTEQKSMYKKLLKSDDLEFLLKKHSKKNKRRFNSVSDDRPYFEDHFFSKLYFSPNFWKRVVEGSLMKGGYRPYLVRLSLFALGFFVILLFSIGFRSGMTSVFNMNYFFILGMGFLGIQVTLIQQVGLFFPDPGLNISFVLMSMLLGAGVGARLEFALQQLRSLWIVLTISYWGCFFFFLTEGKSLLFSLTPMGRVLIVCLLIILGTVFLGAYFPEKMRRLSIKRPNDIAMGWAINGLGGCFITILLPLIVREVGIVLSFSFCLGFYLFAQVFLREFTTKS